MKPVAIVLLLASFASAQKIVAARAGLVYYAEGAFNVDGKNIRSSARDRIFQLEEGQVASTPRGHSEILLGPNAVLWTGTQAQIRFDDTRVENTVVALVEGSVMIEIKRSLEMNRVQVDLGTLNIEITHEGLYRVDRALKTVRVYAGEAVLPNSVKLVKGEESADGVARPFDRSDKDEFHYWAAYRSFMLEQDAGRFREWGGEHWGQRQHAGFGVRFPDTPGAARVKYQASSEAGLLYYMDGSGLIGAQTRTGPVQLPLRLGNDKYLRTDVGKAEVFLGVGVTLRMGENSFLRILDTRSTNPAAALDQGTAMIEVADSDEGAPTRIRIGDSVTELLKPGLYLFDATAKTLRVYGGEASTVVAGSTFRAKEAQTVDLEKAAPLGKFDTKTRDALFRWSADRSFSLFLTPAAFMTPWEPAARAGRYKHKQFGERQDPRPGRRRPPPRF
jgi:hypothetical protein